MIVISNPAPKRSAAARSLPFAKYMAPLLHIKKPRKTKTNFKMSKIKEVNADIIQQLRQASRSLQTNYTIICNKSQGKDKPDETNNA
jgi:hypothetical protein